MASKRNTKKPVSKTEARKKAIVEEEGITGGKAPVNLDKMVEDKKTTGTSFQAYMRDCIKAGKVL